MDFTWKHYPERAAASGMSRGTPGVLYPADGTYSADNSKSISMLGLKYRALNDMLGDLFRSFEELEHAKR